MVQTLRFTKVLFNFIPAPILDILKFERLTFCNYKMTGNITCFSSGEKGCHKPKTHILGSPTFSVIKIGVAISKISWLNESGFIEFYMNGIKKEKCSKLKLNQIIFNNKVAHLSNN